MSAGECARLRFRGCNRGRFSGPVLVGVLCCVPDSEKGEEDCPPWGK